VTLSVFLVYNVSEGLICKAASPRTDHFVFSALTMLVGLFSL